MIDKDRDNDLDNDQSYPDSLISLSSASRTLDIEHPALHTVKECIARGTLRIDK
jgi:hypothetical protein